MKHSAELRLALARINPRFWHIHPDADSRFDACMRRSLTLKDREPIAPLLVPAAHEIAGVGVIDDFYDKDLADISTLSNGGQSKESLLEAAEDAFARRAVDSVLVVCPAAWSSKVTWLSRRDISWQSSGCSKADSRMGIAIHDHLVFGRKGYASFRSLGLLT